MSLTVYYDKPFNYMCLKKIYIGDGRMDSPGQSEQYCTYIFMENETHKILCLVTMDKRMTGRKSAILEKAYFQKGLQCLFEKGIHVVEVVTDAHVQSKH